MTLRFRHSLGVASFMLAGCVGLQARSGMPPLAPAEMRTYSDSRVPSSAAAVVYSFCAKKHCTDGAIPWSSLIVDKSGSFFGTTMNGGAYTSCDANRGCGTVFKLTPAGSGYAEKVLWSFGGSEDGQSPQAGLIEDTRGALYGTTSQGGAHKWGIVFKLIPSHSGKSYQERILYSFCSRANCADGAYPWAALIADDNGALYGTTYGTDTTYGNVFKLTPSGTSYTESVLYNFCSQPGCADGANPRASLVRGKDGSLYGTTWVGGSSGCGCGVVFELTPRSTAYIEKTLWRFTGPNKGQDGYWPSSTLIRDKSGALYGTTELGGYAAYNCNFPNRGCGTVYELAPSKQGFVEKILWRFNILDGALPSGGLTSRDGALYGTTLAGGPNSCTFGPGCGTLFELSRSGSGYAENVLWNFGPDENGFFPDAAPTFDTSGNLYGTTNFGGANLCYSVVQRCGTIYRLAHSTQH